MLKYGCFIVSWLFPGMWDRHPQFVCVSCKKQRTLELTLAKLEQVEHKLSAIWILTEKYPTKIGNIPNPLVSLTKMNIVFHMTDFASLRSPLFQGLRRT